MKPSDYIRKGWCQGANYLDKNGHSTRHPSEATQWCAIGAIDFAFAEKKDRNIFLDKLHNICKGSIELWNDRAYRTKEEVIILLEQVEKELGIV